MALRLSVSGKQILDPSGNPFFPFGTNSRWELWQPRDAAYIKALGCTAVRIEFPWWQTGSAGDSRMDGQPGNIDPVYLARLDAQVASFTGAGLWVDIAIHSKCGRSGADDGAGLGAYCGSVGAYATGHNFYNDPAEKAAHLVLLAFLSNRYKDVDYMGVYEPLNEPDPPGVTDAAVNAYYGNAIDAMLAGDPRAVFIVGGNGGYANFKMAAAYMPARSNVIYTCDLFNQQNSGTTDIDREANFSSRLQSALDLRTTRNVPILIQQFGSHSADDIGRGILAYQLSTLLANKVPCFQWEMRAPTDVVGTAFGWIYIDPATNQDVILRTIDPTLMLSTAAGFAALNTQQQQTMPTVIPLSRGITRVDFIGLSAAELLQPPNSFYLAYPARWEFFDQADPTLRYVIGTDNLFHVIGSGGVGGSSTFAGLTDRVTADIPGTNAATGAAIGAKYTLPGTGMPKTDMAAAVQVSLGKADSALQAITFGMVAATATGTPSSTTFYRGDGSWGIPPGGGGSGTVTNSGALTLNSLVLGNATTDTKVASGFTTDGVSVLTLGVGGTSAGGVAFKNATSGTLLLKPPTGPLGTVTLTMPSLTDTLTSRTSTDTLTNKTFDTAATGNLFYIAGIAVTANSGTGAMVRATSPTFVTPTLGTPFSGDLSNCTALPLGSVTGMAAGAAAFLAAPSSANLRTAMTDETGTGVLVFATSPTLATPTINSPTTTRAKPAANSTVVGNLIAGYNAGATINQFQAVYMGSGGTWLLADADATGTRQCRGLAAAAGTTGNPMNVLDDGIARNDSWSWTPGADVYLSSTPGALTQTAPTSAADVRRIGWALSATEILVRLDSFFVTEV